MQDTSFAATATVARSRMSPSTIPAFALKAGRVAVACGASTRT